MEVDKEFVFRLGDKLTEALHTAGMNDDLVIYIKFIILALTMILLAIVMNFVAKEIILRAIKFVIKRTKNTWDDILLEKHVFDALSHIAPAIAIDMLAKYVFIDFPEWIPWIKKLTDLYIVIVILVVINNMLNVIEEILSKLTAFRDKPVASFIQLFKIFLFLIGFILALAMLLDKSPIYFFSGLGAMTAVLLLIFKDTILGFVGSVQIAANDMVRVGDWVEIPKYGADGDVIEMNLATIKIQNWDRTITTVPTYAFISDSFKNWRGMSESGGRRIKRAIHIKISSIKFFNHEMVERFSKIQLVSNYIRERSNEIEAYNTAHHVDKSILINGRHMTNIGVFRRYAEAYLNNNPHIHKKMTCMVRQLEPTETGLPIEIYAFSNRQEWVIYEGVQSDIFDHLLAVVPSFDLEVFENPSGADFQKMVR